jgi:hypothetical protein
MMASAPQAIWDSYNAVTVKSKTMGGIVGNAAHSFGYHLARDEVPADDYSVELPLDRQGASNCASALDLSLSPADMRTVTKRLLAAAKAHDPRLRALREFCGTTDGEHTHPYDLSNDQDGPLDSWSADHKTHVHLSFYRAFANNRVALAPIIAVINGVPLKARDWFDMATKEEVDKLVAARVKPVLDALDEVQRVLTLIVKGDGRTPDNSQDATGPIVRQTAADVAALGKVKA